jgi:hypothetical protein
LYGFQFNGTAINTEANGLKVETTGFGSAVIGAKLEKVGANLISGTLKVEQIAALEALSNATGIEMDTLKIFL